MSENVSFKCTPLENKAIEAIVSRAALLASKDGPVEPSFKSTLRMDIAACHANGCPLKLRELAKADDFNFCHDVFGINRHIDRETGQLGDFFSPRYSRKAAE